MDKSIRDILSDCDCTFKLEVVDKCPQCGDFHPIRKKHMKKSKWHKAEEQAPPKDRQFYALLSFPTYHEAILHWAGLDGCWLTSPVANPKAKIHIDDILYWRELPKPPITIV